MTPEEFTEMVSQLDLRQFYVGQHPHIPETDDCVLAKNAREILSAFVAYARNVEGWDGYSDDDLREMGYE